MPQRFRISPIHGISGSYGFENEPLTVYLSGFYSTEDGEQFVTVAEQLTNALSGTLREIGIRPSQIDNLLISIDEEGNGTLYCNELDFRLCIRAKRDVKKGEGITEDDVLDVEELHLYVDGTPMIPPKDSALIFIFSVGWRKGLYFNFTPLKPDEPEPLPDLARLFGALFCRVQFQEKFRSICLPPFRGAEAYSPP
ncbi:MAG: hypothetical protein ACJ76Y_00280 [Thermoanaerobaculia bacterium]